MQHIDRSHSGQRRYSNADLRWLSLVGKLRRTGMSVADMIRYAELARAGEHTFAERQELLQATRRDVLTRMLFGGRVSILIGLLAAVVGTLLGTAIGAAAGYHGGRIDNMLMRITDVAYAIPTLPLLIILSAYSRAALVSMVLIIGLLSWMTTARVVRSQVLSIKEMDYVEAARSMGATDLRILARHIVPNALGPILVGATLGVGNAIMIESSETRTT